MTQCRAAGFTLLELLIVLLIMGLVVSLAPAVYHKAFPQMEARSLAQRLTSDLRRMRSHAIAENRPLILHASDGTFVYTEGRQTKTYDLPEGAAVRLLDDLAPQGSKDESSLTFNVDGSSSGGAVVLEYAAQEFRINVDWLTGHARLAER